VKLVSQLQAPVLFELAFEVRSETFEQTPRTGVSVLSDGDEVSLVGFIGDQRDDRPFVAVARRAQLKTGSNERVR